MKTLPILFAGIMLGALAANGAESPAPPSTETPRNAEVEKLIDQLLDVSTETVGANAKATLMSQFMANDLPPVFKGGLSDHALPPTPPVMRKIVEMGVVAVPSLLDHLSDARETKLVIWNPGIPKQPVDAPLTFAPLSSAVISNPEISPQPAGGASGGVRFGMIMYNDEYDPRYRDDPARIPAEVNTLGQVPHGLALYALIEPMGDSYTMKVGDLCYVLLGQIVDRNLTAARYQGSSSVIINSPVQNPALAAAARKDWSGLTPAEHQASLVEDATGDAHKRSLMVDYTNQHQAGFERLSFYYPAATKATELMMLAHPLADWHYQRIGALTAELLAEPDAAKRAALLTSAQKNWGNAFVPQIVETYTLFTPENPPLPNADGTWPDGWRPRGDTLVHTTKTERGSSSIVVYPHPQWDRATEALATIAKEGWATSRQTTEAASIFEQISLIKSLGGAPDPELDAAVHEVFLKAEALLDPQQPADAPFNQLAEACLAQFQKSPTANEKFIAEIQAAAAKSADSTAPATQN